MQPSKIKNLIEQNKSGAGELVVVEGLHAVKHALRFKAEPEVIVTVNKAKLLELSNKLCPDITERLKELVEEVGEGFELFTESTIRTGIFGLFHKPKDSKGRVREASVLLDDPKDLDNIGATVRVCAAAGIKTLIVTGESNPWNSRAIRAGAGLQFALDIQVLSIKEVLGIGIPIISFDERGEVLDPQLKSEIPKQAIYVFGSERDGISKELKRASARIVCLPMQGGVSSLNLATSVAAALYSLK